MPMRLPGRSDAQIWWRRSLTEIQATGASSLRGRVFTGVRGVGKTALLRDFARSAQQAGFGVVLVQAGGGDATRAYVLERLRRLEPHEPETFEDKHGHLTELAVGAGPVSLAARRELPDDPQPPDPPLEDEFLGALESAARRFRANGAGVALLVDEAQDSDLPSLTSICRAAHLLERPALQIVLAGLPGLDDRLDEAMSHADRLFEYRVLSNLDPDATREALVEPALSQGVRWQTDALNRLVDLSRGYPSFIQEYGHATWTAKGSATLIDDAVVEAGIAAAQQNLDRQFRSVWRGVTPAGQDYLTALAGLGGTARSAEVAAALGKETRQLSVALQTLKQRGAVLSPAYGVVSFVRPGMDRWITENRDLLTAERGAELPAITSTGP